MTHTTSQLHALLMFALLAPHAGTSAQNPPPASDTPEALAAMRAFLPPLPAAIPHWHELPAEVRRELADFRIEMHRWHADPEQRFVMVGGRRVEEGGVLGRELWLREIRPESVVVQFRDRFFQRVR